MNSKNLHMIWQLARCEFKMRDQSTMLGFLWTLLYPVLLFSVLYMLFVKWMGPHIPAYPAYLMVGVLQWNYFNKATTCGLNAILVKNSLINNFLFPREILVISTVLTNLAIHLLELLVLSPVLLYVGAGFSWLWVLFPIAIALETVLILGVSLFLARLAVEYKDTLRIWEIATFAGFFVTPIFYDLRILSPERQKILMFNPMARIITETRSFIVYGQIPDFEVLGILAVVVALLCYAGHRYFKNGESLFAEKFP